MSDAKHGSDTGIFNQKNHDLQPDASELTEIYDLVLLVTKRKELFFFLKRRSNRRLNIRVEKKRWSGVCATSLSTFLSTRST